MIQAFAHVAQTVQKLRNHVNSLPELAQLPRVPKEGVLADMGLFVAARKAVAELPQSDASNTAQFFQDDTQKAIAGIKSDYAMALMTYADKAKVPVTATLKHALPGMDLKQFKEATPSNTSTPSLSLSASAA